MVGNLNILKANFKHENRVPFIIDLIRTLKKRGAYKTFTTEASPEEQVGAIREADLPEAVGERTAGEPDSDAEPREWVAVHSPLSSRRSSVSVRSADESVIGELHLDALKKAVRALGLQSSQDG